MAWVLDLEKSREGTGCIPSSLAPSPGFPQNGGRYLNWNKIFPWQLFSSEYFIRATGGETKTTRLSLVPFSFQTAAPNVFAILQMSQSTSKSTYSQNLSQYSFGWIPSPWSPYWVQHDVALISMSQCDLMDWRCSLAGEQLPSTYSSGCNLQCTQRKNISIFPRLTPWLVQQTSFSYFLCLADHKTANAKLKA